MVYLELYSRKQDHQRLLEDILRADGLDGEVESFDLGDQVIFQLPLTQELGSTLEAKTIPGVTINPNPFKSDTPYPLTARIECQVIQRSHTIVPDIGGQGAFGYCTLGMTIALQAVTDEGEEVILRIKDGMSPD